MAKEIEILSFIINGCTYGADIATVSEIIKYQHITPVPGTDNRVCGVFMPRDELISVVDLRYCLVQQVSTEENSPYMIICRFGDRVIAYPIDNVIGITRVSEEDIISPSTIINQDGNGVITGIIKLENDIVSVLGLERVVKNINLQLDMSIEEFKSLEQKANTEESINDLF